VTTVLFDDYDQHSTLGNVDGLTLRRLVEPGPLLGVCHRLLLRVFDSAVVDPIETYESLLSPSGLRSDGFPPLGLACTLERQGELIVFGFVSASVMWIDKASGQAQLAIGNVATSPRAKAMGVRGIGSMLWHAAAELGKFETSQRNGQLIYSVAEAEPESLGFWQKMGYLRPQGVRYLQPPLAFDDEGRPIEHEVPETFVIRPLGEVASHQIGAAVVRNMILAIYRNWCIEPSRTRLSPSAMTAVESYVLSQVFPRVDATIPKDGFIQLVAPI
jgi:hypothetical protein